MNLLRRAAALLLGLSLLMGQPAEAKGLFRSPVAPPRVLSGLEVLLSDSLACVQGRRVALVTNQTGRDAQGRSTIELLAGHPRLKLVRLFAPEHGLDGSRPAGEQIRDERDPGSGLPVSSLYQGSNQVDPALLAGLDQVLFDIQDIGIRPYTFTSTLAEVMKAARKAKVEVVVLDRPNPTGGQLLGGLTLEPAWSSFIGLYSVPYVHGLTIGELARLYNQAFQIGCRLRVIPMRGWRRSMTQLQTGLPWIPTSPNVPSWDTPLAMGITGALGELGTVSIGIGTASPFWVAGTVEADAEAMAAAFNAAQVPGLRAIPWRWTPSAGSWSGKTCRGIRLLVTDLPSLDPGLAQLALLDCLKAGGVDPLAGAGEAQRRMFCKALGTERILARLADGRPLADLKLELARENRAFRELRRAALLYPD
jgi:uncharacterized protein YbbC (DUF1343 family)